MTRRIVAALADRGALRTATTGRAAVCLSNYAVTMHSAFWINSRVVFHRSVLTEKAMTVLRCCHIIIVDEMSGAKADHMRFLMDGLMRRSNWRPGPRYCSSVHYTYL